MKDVIGKIERARALIFDCDGTLVDSGSNYGAAWAEALCGNGSDLPPGWYEEHSGYSTPAFLDEFERVHDVALDRRSVVAKMEAAYARMLPSIRAVAPIARYVRDYHGKKKMAVASNGARDVVHASLRSIGLHSFFDAVVTLEDVTSPKPSPALFQEAARRLGFSPGDCLVFEDSPQGFAAARAGGFPFIDIKEIVALAAEPAGN
jgi:HAD superfamily hydrolase (TIGR01509 family)